MNNQIEKSERTSSALRSKTTLDLAKEFILVNGSGLLMLAYMVFYFAVFGALDQRLEGVNYTLISCWIDDLIPFCEVFVLPYLAWFFYVGITFLILYFTDREAFKRGGILLAIAMTVFLLVSWLFPNCLAIRPVTMPRSNIFTHLIAGMWRADPAVCVLPSIHVCNSLITHWTICGSKSLGSKKTVVWASAIQCASIIFATVLIKQHSVIDVTLAFLLVAVIIHLRNIISIKYHQHKQTLG